MKNPTSSYISQANSYVFIILRIYKKEMIQFVLRFFYIILIICKKVETIYRSIIDYIIMKYIVPSDSYSLRKQMIGDSLLFKTVEGYPVKIIKDRGDSYTICSSMDSSIRLNWLINSCFLHKKLNNSILDTYISKYCLDDPIPTPIPSRCASDTQPSVQSYNTTFTSGILYIIKSSPYVYHIVCIFPSRRDDFIIEIDDKNDRIFKLDNNDILRFLTNIINTHS